MFKATAHLESISPYSPSRMHGVEKLEKERPDDYEKRTWREKCHYREDGTVFLPPMGFKICLAECAKFLGEQIPGKGKATWTKHFEAGVLCMEPVDLPVKKDDLQGEWFNMNADGIRAQNEPETADAMAGLLADRKQHAELARLRRGLRRLSFRSVCRIATRHSHVCPVYVRGHLSTLTTMVGLFWWNDGGSTVRERLLMLAWKKGARP